MAITKAKKEEIVEKLKGATHDAGSVVFVHFKGFNVADTTAMRNKLRAEGVGYYVAKKTLMKRALATLPVEGTQPPLEGEIALVFGLDSVAPAREVNEFAKKSKNAISIVGGIFENRYMNASEMMEIATIPSLHTLHAQFVNLINSPIQRMAVVLDQIAQKKAS